MVLLLKLFLRNYRSKIAKRKTKESNYILYTFRYINVYIIKLPYWYMEIAHCLSNNPKIMETLIQKYKSKNNFWLI